MSTDKPKKLKDLKSKIKNFWLKYEAKIVIAIGLILVAIISFESGILKGQKWQQEPLVIEKPSNTGNSGSCQVSGQNTASQASNNPSQTQNLASEGQKTPEAANNTPKECAFAGSKNSTKYHKPTCQWAKRIKPENMVCFKSEEEAKSRGYNPCGTCLK